MAKKMTMAERILNEIGSGPHDTKAEVLSEVLEIADACEDMLCDRRWRFCSTDDRIFSAVCILRSVGCEFQWDERRGREIVRISRTRSPVARDLWRRISKARELAAAGNYDAVPEYIPGLPW